LVWGVNVFHLARHLDRVLAEAREALAPGGWLVVGEGVRPAPGEPVGAELPFQLLESFHDVVLDPVTRPTAGFLTADVWESALRRAGFAPVEIVPDLARLRLHYAGFLGAAFCGRRA
jgi:SAM-dependent methyltransferase